jgi:hypothetical protein
MICFSSTWKCQDAYRLLPFNCSLECASASAPILVLSVSWIVMNSGTIEKVTSLPFTLYFGFLLSGIKRLMISNYFTPSVL